MNTLSIKNLTKGYGSKLALDHFSLELSGGGVVAFLGPNGAGKSTLFKILLGLRKPATGDVHILGRPPWHPSLRNEVGYTSQDLSYPPHLRVREIVAFVSTHFHDCQGLNETREQFDLAAIWNRQIGGLSGGERRRLGLACALIGRPKILILDEPTTGLDLESRRSLWRQVQLFKDAGGSVWLATHDLNDVAQVADDVVLIDHGRVLFHGPLKQILRSMELKRVAYNLDGRQVIELIADADAHVRRMVVEQVTFTDLEIHPASLEEAILKMRGRE